MILKFELAYYTLNHFIKKIPHLSQKYVRKTISKCHPDIDIRKRQEGKIIWNHLACILVFVIITPFLKNPTKIFFHSHLSLVLQNNFFFVF